MSENQGTITVYLAGDGEMKTTITSDWTTSQEVQESLSDEQRVVVPVQAWHQILAALVNTLRSVEVRDEQDEVGGRGALGIKRSQW